MCKDHSFIVTRSRRVFDGCGLTDSHTTIRELAGLSPEDDTVNSYEWQPPAGWPDADFWAGITVDTEVFSLKKSHLVAIEKHLRKLYPDMAAWNAGHKIHDFPSGIKIIKGEIVVPAGQTLTLPKVVEAGRVVVHGNGTVTAPKMVEAGRVYVRGNGTVTAPAMTRAGDVVVYDNGTVTAPAMTRAGDVVVHDNGTVTAPAMVEAGYVGVYGSGTLTASAALKTSGAEIINYGTINYV